MILWTWLSNGCNIISVSTFLLSGYAAWQLAQRRRQMIELARQTPKAENFKAQLAINDGVRSSNPIALAICVTPEPRSIRQNVQTYLDHRGVKMPIEEIVMNGINNDDDKEKFFNELRRVKNLVGEQKNTELHLFIAGPLCAAMWVGAMYDNWLPVKLYQRPSPAPIQIYEYWGPLM